MKNSIIDSKTAYFKLYINKKHKELVNDDRLDTDILGIKSWDAPYLYLVNDEGRYYVFEDENYSSKDIGFFLEKLYNYCYDDFIFTIGYNKDSYCHKYIVNNGKISFDDYNDLELRHKYNELYNYISSAVERFDDYYIYIDDSDFFDDVVPNDDLDCDSFEELLDKLNKTNNIIIFELAYMEEIVELIKYVEPIVKSEYQYNKDKKRIKLTYVKDIYVTDNDKIEKSYSRNNESKSSWKDKIFNREANLWGLSKEDRRIAKQERMSPADYIEAEERDDDNLDDDD